MMAQYSRQVNMEPDSQDNERSLSPTCEVLSDGAKTIFVSPSLSYRLKYTSLWKRRSGLEKLLMLLVLGLLILFCTSLIIFFVNKQERFIKCSFVEIKYIWRTRTS